MNQQKNYCEYVDVFYGNGAVDHFPESGPASKWFYIKALCGNTIPHAVRPFGRMSVGAYSGGYPTGYGTHCPNYCGGIRHFQDRLKIRGFSHLHQSGTGAIAYYYNYAVTTPFYGSPESIHDFHEITEEKGTPGYYSAVMNGIFCEFTATENTAFHHYRFPRDGGRVAIDFSNDGLSPEFPEQFRSLVQNARLQLGPSGECFFSGILSGIQLYFCAAAEGDSVKSHLFYGREELSCQSISGIDPARSFGVIFDSPEKDFNIHISFSTISFEKAHENLNFESNSFSSTAEASRQLWDRYPSSIQIETSDEELKEKFYSNLYHSLVKPCTMTGEGEAVLEVPENPVTDLATFWDQYKTALPLIYLLYPEMGSRIVRTVRNISRTMGRIPCSFGLTDIFPCEEQAKMLGILTLCDAHHLGIPEASPDVISECILRELARPDFASFLESGYFERYTHILDTTDACLAAADITEDPALHDRLLQLSAHWKNAYGPDGLMSEASPYYEGDRYTYSFRLQHNMDERIRLAGGPEAFVRMLDEFFGFSGESIHQLTYPGADADIVASRHHRFEGFNNECDMETPYAYLYAGRHDRTCEIIHSCITQSFTTGKGALPGNNDSGGLSSCFVWNMLGLFPTSGTGDFLIGSPHVDRAVLQLANGKTLEILDRRPVDAKPYVQDVTFNGQAVSGYRIPMKLLAEGGKLVFQS